MVNLNIRMDESERSKVLRACETRGCSMSELAREALRTYLSNEPQKVEKEAIAIGHVRKDDSLGERPTWEMEITEDGRVWQRPKGSDIW